MRFPPWLVLILATAPLAGCGDGDDTTPDGASPDATAQDAAPIGPDAMAARLSETGLYANIAAKTINPNLLAFAPTHVLWSDAADKRRWIELPAGTQIDTTDMDHWQFPIGTRVFKEFAQNGKLLETRLIEKIDVDEFRMNAYVWRDDESDADLAVNGAQNIRGTQHDAPSSFDCRTCHRGEPGRILGFSALQLSRSSSDPNETTLAKLMQRNLLSTPPMNSAGYPAPGDATTAAALGYLHANCGHCHNPSTPVFNQTHMVLRIDIAQRTPQTTNTYLTAWNLDAESAQYIARHPGIKRIEPGKPMQSAIWQRMNARGDNDQMPPEPFTEVKDQTGIDAVSAFIMNFTP